MDDFDEWNFLKKDIDAKDSKSIPFLNEGEVWQTAVGRNVGHEQNGPSPSFMRPALIIKKFNNQLAWVVPLTSKQKPFDFYFNFTDPRGLKAAAILSQLTPASPKRMEKMLYKMPVEIFLEIKKRLKDYF